MAIKLKHGRALGALSLTPMIDVVFLLLIFFLVASRLSQEARQLDIALPSAANAMPMTAEPQELVVNVDQVGKLYLESRELALDQFESFLRQQVADNPYGRSVIIRADRRVPFQAPVDVMNVCLKLGVPYSASMADQ
ncbi:MAG: biopolymer transporter ExbD [Pirellulaceae bacterium]|nr:biopolymer transporter ExbD [Pirellulaceae bacterium]